MPTAMPDAPLISRFGASDAGKTEPAHSSDAIEILDEVDRLLVDVNQQTRVRYVAIRASV